MKSSIVKRSIELHGHKTSVSLEDEFWNGLRAIAELKNCPLPDMLQAIDAARGVANLSSAIRVHVLEYYRAEAELLAAKAQQSRLAPTLPPPTTLYRR